MIYYPTSKVRGISRECQAAMAQEWPRRATQVRGQGQRPGGATPRPRSGVVAERSYPMSKARGSGQKDQPQARGQGQWTGGPTPCPRSGGCVGTGGPRGATLRSRSEGVEVRRYSSSKVRETQVRRYVLQEGIRGQTH